jgi:hypothetical protein
MAPLAGEPLVTPKHAVGVGRWRKWISVLERLMSAASALCGFDRGGRVNYERRSFPKSPERLLSYGHLSAMAFFRALIEGKSLQVMSRGSPDCRNATPCNSLPMFTILSLASSST